MVVLQPGEFNQTDGTVYFAFDVNGDIDVTDDTYGTDDTG